MADNLCTKCDGRGFKKPEDGKMLTALAEHNRCSTCGGYGRVRDSSLKLTISVFLMSLVAVWLVYG